MSTDPPIRMLVDQVRRHVHDEAVCGRLYADLTDMLECCNWFVSAVNAQIGKLLNQDELETLLIDIDTRMLQHLAYHIDSLRKDMPALLNAIGLSEDNSGGE